MIEDVSPDDTAKLDEIDLHVFDFLQSIDDRYNATHHDDAQQPGTHIRTWKKPYTRSREALKTIRPVGWRFVCWPTSCDALGQRTELLAASLPTEELAELHAIVQAIAFDRSHAQSCAER